MADRHHALFFRALALTVWILLCLLIYDNIGDHDLYNQLCDWQVAWAILIPLVIAALVLRKQVPPRPTAYHEFDTDPRNVSDIVNIFVGNEGKLFQVSKHRLSSVSKFFDDALSSDSEEALTNIIGLPDVGIDIFAVFANWLENYGPPHLPDLDFSVAGWPYASAGRLIDLYIFAYSKNCCSSFLNLIMDTFQEEIRVGRIELDENHIIRVFDGFNSYPEVPICRFCIALIAYNLAKGVWSFERISEFFQENRAILVEYLRLRKEYVDLGTDSPDDPDTSDLYHPCFFHVHGDGEPCTTRPDEYELWPIVRYLKNYEHADQLWDGRTVVPELFLQQIEEARKSELHVR